MTLLLTFALCHAHKFSPLWCSRLLAFLAYRRISALLFLVFEWALLWWVFIIPGFAAIILPCILYLLKVCAGWHYCHSWSLWLWQDCYISISVQIFQLRCHHLCRMWGARKWNVWGEYLMFFHSFMMFLDFKCNTQHFKVWFDYFNILFFSIITFTNTQVKCHKFNF